MRLVENERVVAQQAAVALDLGEQDPVGHQLDQGAITGLVGEPDGVADRFAERGPQFVGDALGDRAGRQSPRLGVADGAPDTAAQFQADLRQLGGLARTGFAGDHHDLVRADRRGDLVAPLTDWQVGIRDRRDRRGAHGDQRLRGGELPRQFARIGPAVSETPAQPVRVADRQAVEARTQGAQLLAG